MANSNLLFTFYLYLDVNCSAYTCIANSLKFNIYNDSFEQLFNCKKYFMIVFITHERLAECHTIKTV